MRLYFFQVIMKLLSVTSSMVLVLLLFTTRKVMFYDVISKSVLKDRLKKDRNGIFVIRDTNIAIYVAGSKAVTQNRLRK